MWITPPQKVVPIKQKMQFEQKQAATRLPEEMYDNNGGMSAPGVCVSAAGLCLCCFSSLWLLCVFAQSQKWCHSVFVSCISHVQCFMSLWLRCVPFCGLLCLCGCIVRLCGHVCVCLWLFCVSKLLQRTKIQSRNAGAGV